MSRKWAVYNLWHNINDIRVSDMFSVTAGLLCMYFYLHPSTPVLLYHAI
jgi:hypothetical protein